MKLNFTPTIHSLKHLCLIILVLVTVNAKMTWKVGNHDSRCYTQGLSFINQTHVLQSCGMYGESYFQIHNFDPTKNTLTTKYKSNLFSNRYFLEGSIYFPNNKIFYILTWQQRTVFRYKYSNELGKFEELSQLPWNTEGWGMTHNNTHIFISDGSEKIYVTDSDLKILKTLSITRKGISLRSLNELEWIEQNGKQYIYANVYLQSYLAKISIDEQKVVQTWDLANLKDTELRRGGLRSDQVLNGIAIYKNRIIVTGKRWRSFFSTQFSKA